MERRVFDNEKFINLVEPKQCLWDTAHADYCNRNKKEEAWIEVCRTMEENFDQLTSVKKNDYARDLQKKWKNLRNSFARELAKRKTVKSGSPATWKTYVFFDQLSFLMRCPSHKQTTSSLTVDREQTDDPSLQKDSQPVRKKLRLSQHDRDDQIAELLKETIRRREANQNQLDKDEDRHFLLSLLEDFKRVPAERKMDVKLGIIETIRTASSPTRPYFSPHTDFNYSAFNLNPSIFSQMHSASTPLRPFMLQPTQLRSQTHTQLNTHTEVGLHSASALHSSPLINSEVMHSSTPQPEPGPMSDVCSPQSCYSSTTSNDGSIIDLFTQFNSESNN